MSSVMCDSVHDCPVGYTCREDKPFRRRICCRYKHFVSMSYGDSGSYFGVSSSGNSKREFYYDTYDPIVPPPLKITAPPVVRPKRPALVADAPPAATVKQAMAATTSLGFGLGLGRYGNEMPSPIDAEIQQTVLEMQQELAFVESLPSADNLRHSIRLLKDRCLKLENTVDPDWIEVDISKPIRVTKRILIPNFRHPTINFVGRILGAKGSTLQNIAKKYKAHISIMGAGSTKDAAKEAELLSTGDPNFSHFASPLHVRIDVIAAPHVAHTRLAGLLNLFHKLLMPLKDVIIEGINDGTYIYGKDNGVEEDGLTNEIEEIVEESHQRSAIKRAAGHVPHDFTPPSTKLMRGVATATRSVTRGAPRGRGRGGFVPRVRSSS